MGYLMGYLIGYLINYFKITEFELDSIIGSFKYEKRNYSITEIKFEKMILNLKLTNHLFYLLLNTTNFE